MGSLKRMGPVVASMTVQPRRGSGGQMLFAAILAGAVLTPVSCAFAQAAPPAPVPGSQLPTREELDRGVALGTLNKGGPVAVDTSEVERAPCPLASPEFAGIRFKVTSVVFAGLDKLPDMDLSGSYRDFIGTDQPVAVICEIRDRAATTLRKAGYLAAVQVPPQKIADGAVRLDVMLARLTRIQIKGDAGASEGALLRYLNKLTEDPVFNTKKAERYLLLAKDVPGLDVRLALRPVEGAPGEVLGEVSVRNTPVFADLTVQNYGSRAIGRYSGLARVQINGLTGLGDATTVSFFATPEFREQKVLQLAHTMRIGGEGLTLNGGFTYGWTNPTVTGATSDFHSRTLVASLELQYPFVRSQAFNVYGAGGIDLVNQDVDFGAIRLNRDRLRVAYARLDLNGLSKASLIGRDGFTPYEPHWNWGLSLEARQGLNVLDASRSCAGAAAAACLGAGGVTPSRVEGSATSTVFRASGELDYRPVPAITLSIAPRLQYSMDTLLSYEEYSGGNYTIGRGYDPGALIGDSGVGVRTELRLGSQFPKEPRGTAVQPYAFFDAAWVWNRDKAFVGLDPQKLFSVGGGIRATLHDMVRIDALVAVPLRDVVGQAVQGDVRFLFNVSVQLAPWRL
jgi:hemolysin activation/secretion protein